MRRGANLPSVGGYNQTVVLDAIRHSPQGMSRVELAAATGLSAQTVSNVCRRLLEAGLVRDGGRSVGGVGKPRAILRLDPTGRCAIGIHLDPARITLVLLDLEGAVIAHTSIRTPTAPHPGETLDTVARAVGALVAESGAPVERIVGAGIAAPGPIDRDRGMVVRPPLLPAWEEVALRDALAERLGLPVVLEKDVTAAAIAELWTQPPGTRDNAAFFYYGTGTGIGLIVQHEVVRGASNNAGDSGHIIVSADGPLCPCGRRGCVGETVSPRRLVEAAVAAGVPVADADGTLPPLADAFARLGAAAGAGDPGALAVLEPAITGTATALVIVANLLDLDRIVFGGPFFAPVARMFLDRIPALVSGSPSLVPQHPILVTETTVGDDVAAVGAACLILDSAFSPRPADLLIDAAAI